MDALEEKNMSSKLDTVLYLVVDLFEIEYDSF